MFFEVFGTFWCCAGGGSKGVKGGGGLGVCVAKVGKRVGLWWLFCLFFYFPTFCACRGRDCLLL